MFKTLGEDDEAKKPEHFVVLVFSLDRRTFFFKVYSLFIAIGESKNSQTGGGRNPKGIVKLLLWPVFPINA